MNKWNSTPQFEDDIRQSFGVPEIRLEFVDKLHGDLLQQAEMKSKKLHFALHLQPAWIVVLVLVILLTACTLIIGPERVYTTIRKFFGYIPGVGIVDKSSSIRVLAEPISITREDITITVTSATLTNERTHIDYRIFGVPGSAYPDSEEVIGCNQQPFLRLPDGSLLTREKDFPPIPDRINKVVLVLPCIPETLPGKVPENWELTLRFIPASSNLTMVPVIETLPTQTPLIMANTHSAIRNPLTITRVLDIGNQYILMGEFDYSAVQDTDLPAGSWWNIQKISIIGADGRVVPETYSNDFSSPPPSQPNRETWLYQLKKDFVPPITITYSGEIISPVGLMQQKEFEFETGLNPQDGKQWTMNENFRLGGYHIRLVSIESSPSGYSFQFIADPGTSANDISVDIEGYTPNCGGGGNGHHQFPEEFKRVVCYANIPGSPEFPHGKLKAIIKFQTLNRQERSFQIHWSPDSIQNSPFATSTPRTSSCLTTDSIDHSAPVPLSFTNGKALLYELINSKTNQWGLVLYNLDGSKRQILALDANWGALSYDGNHLAYPANDGIHIIDLTTHALRVLKDISGFNLIWSPDGKKISYVGMGEDVTNNIFIINSDGSQARQVSKLSFASVIGWSADSSHLYFVAPFTGGAAWKVFSIDLVSNIQTELFIIENGTPKFLNAKISPDGKWIAYRGQDNSSLYLVHPDGSDMHLIFDNIGVVGVEWSHSGWLGISVHEPNSDKSAVKILKPDGCEVHNIPITFNGDIEGLFIP